MACEQWYHINLFSQRARTLNPPPTMDLDALFATPGFMPGYYNIEDRFFASDGKLYFQFLLNLSLKRRRRGRKPHCERKRVRQLYEAFILQL
jgi:hypothetical protein